MEMPKPSEEHHRLARLSGRWVGEEILHPSPWDPDGGRAKGRMRGRMALGGFHLILEYEQERDGKTTFEGHGVLGWDPDEKKYTLHWFDSHGAVEGSPATGTWEGNVLSLERESRKQGLGRQVYDATDDELRFRLEHSRNGREWKPFLEGTYKRLG